MTLRLVDTNIVSFDMRGHSLGLRYKPHLDGYTLAVAFKTVAEIYEGAWMAGWGSRRLRHMETVLGRYTVLYANDDLCRLWGMVREQRRRQPIGVADAWIAAVALQYGCDLVTHNPRDFQGVAGLTIITEAP